jgi:signal transduction histidine kinase
MGTDGEHRGARWGWPAEAVLLAAVAVVQLAGAPLAARHQAGGRDLDTWAFLLLAAAVAMLVFRRRWPVPTLAAVFAATLGYSLLDYPGGPIWLPLIIAFGTVLLTGHRLAAYVSLAAGYGAFLWLVNAATGRPYPTGWAIVGLAAWLLLLAAVAELVRNRRAYQQASRQRAEEEQRTRDEQVRRQASEERLGIARELHDVLAHSISMINVQAGVALELMEQRPEQARTALTAIKRASKDALVEVQAVLGSLRGAGQAEVASAPRAPATRLADLAGLVGTAEAAGLAVHTEISGESTTLPAGVELAAFRIVQEALTNVVRHAGARTATVRVDYGPDELLVQVDDDGRRRPVLPLSNGGSGIAGMRERADALGGQLTATVRPGGGFRVAARLPVTSSGPAVTPSGPSGSA